MDHLPSCSRHQLSKLWLGRLNRDILNNYGRSCLGPRRNRGILYEPGRCRMWQAPKVVSAEWRRLSLAGRNCMAYRAKASPFLQPAVVQHTNVGKGELLCSRENPVLRAISRISFNYTQVLSCTSVILRWTRLHINWRHLG